MQKIDLKVKVIITGVLLLSAFALLALGTFAWYTLSKQGDVSGVNVSFVKDGEQWPFEIIQQDDTWTTLASVNNASGWKKNLTLRPVAMTEVDKITGDESTIYRTVQDCYQLRPISTYDGVHWYIADYDGGGNVKGFLLRDDLNTIGNINRYDPVPSESGEDIPSNYLYYYDIWIRNQSQEHPDYKLHLNNPNQIENPHQDQSELFFGTYVVPGLKDEQGTGHVTKSNAGYDVSSCIRVGFLFYNSPNVLRNSATPGSADYVSYETPGDFWIYEPNCDVHNIGFEDYDKYNALKSYGYINTAASSSVTVASHNLASDGNIVDTWLPKYESDETSPVLSTKNDYTIQQLKSSWDESKISNLHSASDARSTDMGVLGKFKVHNPGPGEETYSYTNTPPLATINNAQPQHIRVFIWMEGQDIDCWNSSLRGNLAINLEFRGEAAD